MIKIKKENVFCDLRRGRSIANAFISKYRKSLKEVVAKLGLDDFDNCYVDITAGRPWFGNNGILEVYVKFNNVLKNDESLSATFELQFNHDRFVTSDSVVGDVDRWDTYNY